MIDPQVENASASAVPIGILVTSDRAAQGIYEDRGGPAIVAYLKRVLTTPFKPHLIVCADDEQVIAGHLRELADRICCPLILSTGGTGPAPRDVTPEATMAVCDRLLPGFGEAMRTASLREVPTAILSRQLAGTRGQSLIINLPGKPSSIQTCLDAVFSAVPYCIDLIGGARLDTDQAVCRAFRPAI
jgi:molybdopterin adenylyltransferase